MDNNPTAEKDVTCVLKTDSVIYIFSTNSNNSTSCILFNETSKLENTSDSHRDAHRGKSNHYYLLVIWNKGFDRRVEEAGLAINAIYIYTY